MANDDIELTEEITEFMGSVRYESLPQEMIELGKTHILDSIACGIAGAKSQAAKIALDYLENGGGALGSSTVIGAPVRLAPRFAAFINGLSMHADDFDDTGPQPSSARNGGIHATVPILSVLLALSEEKKSTGREIITALHTGVEITCKLNHASNEEHYRRGYHSTATIGMFGTTAAAALCLGLNKEQQATALNIVSSQSSGLRLNFGSMMNPFHAGHVAECAIVSTELARRGFTASKKMLEHPEIGFLKATGGTFDADAIMNKLGKPWAFIDPGMWIKPYPCGALTHPALTALIDLTIRENIMPEKIKSVKVQTNRNLVNTLIHNRPTIALQAKFSMPFAVAIAIKRRRASLGDYTDEVVNEPMIQELIKKVEFTAYDKREENYTNVTTLIQVELTDGHHFEIRADFGKGNPRNPMRFDDVSEKFLGCADFAGWSTKRANDIIEFIRSFDKIDNICKLTALLRPTP